MGTPPGDNAEQRLGESKDWSLTRDQIETIALDASDSFTAQTHSEPYSRAAHTQRTGLTLGGQFPTLPTSATKAEQAEMHLFAAIVTALLPFYEGNAQRES